MPFLFRLAKSSYLLVFNALACHILRRKKRRVSNEPSHAIKVICRYGGQGGITNGAVHNGVALELLGYKVERIDVSSAMKNPFKRVASSDGGHFIFHCAAPQFLLLAWPLRRVFRTGKVIGYFAWELADPPKNWPKYEGLWDEIWTPSIFSAQSLAKLYDCPIRVVPHVVLNECVPRMWRKGEEPLTFLTMADARSSLARKNPHAVVAAFRSAFPHESDVSLVIKLQIKRPTSEVERLFAIIGGDPRIRIIQKTMSRPDVDQLLRDAHVYVSLHRAEGFGLPLLEARLFGLATIATAWSANLDFMTAEDSVLIPYELVKMQDEGGVYGEVTWAEPDLAAAASAMRRFYEDQAYLARITKSGWEASRPEKQLARFAAALKLE